MLLPVLVECVNKSNRIKMFSVMTSSSYINDMQLWKIKTFITRTIFSPFSESITYTYVMSRGVMSRGVMSRGMMSRGVM